MGYHYPPRYLPMWGESKNTHPVTPSLTGTTIGTVPLLRSVARINVGLNMPPSEDDPQGLGENFLIEEIQVHNVSGNALAAPFADHFTSEKVTAPSLPANPATGTITYKHTVADNKGFINEIYIGETSKTTAPCILIGAYYTPAGSAVPNTTEKTWYKLVLYDYSKTDPYSSPLDFLRNHYYRVNITAINEGGYATETEALNNPDSSLQFDLQVYDEAGEINYVVYNNHYMLGVSESHLKVEWGEHKNVELKVLTDYTGGWELAEITNSPEEGGDPVDWITNISRTNKPAGQKDILTFTIEEGWGVKRKAYLHLKAGTLKQVVTITQKGLPNAYFMKPGGEIEIPVKKAYGVWADDVMADKKELLTGAVTYELIWQDAQNLVTIDYAPGSSSLTAEKTYLKIATNGSIAGNALVGVNIGGIRRYSWHIWITDYDPETQQNGLTYTYHNGVREYTFMDRNLGATTVTPAVITTHGLMYQWGRKDPMPGPTGVNISDISATSHKNLYQINNGSKKISVKSIPTTTGNNNNIYHTLLNPDVFYITSAPLYDWYTTSSERNFQNDYLWSDEDEDKGTFDPCPKEWRVGAFINEISPWAVNVINQTWDPSGGNTWLLGWRFDSGTYGGYYPAVGQIGFNNGFFQFIGTTGRSWLGTANPLTHHSYNLEFTNTKFQSNRYT
ncbi:MAG: hypothetical protein LIP01_01970, partial [Tannerellaceae bacterium]|nr:hypothetical protein [Tannerellaceae bacterium]